MPVRVLFYYPFNQTMSGGARTLLNLVRDAELHGVQPIVASQSENPLIQAVRQQRIEAHVLPFPPVLDVYNKKALSYTVFQKVRAAGAMAAYNRRFALLIERCRARAVWARSTKGMLMTGLAARWKRRPAIWDIGLEQRQGAFMRALQGMALCVATGVVTQAQRQPTDIFGPVVAQLLARKFRAIYPGVDEERRVQIREATSEADRKSHERFEVLCLASLYPRKNQLMLLRALRGLVQKHPRVRVRLVGPPADEDYASHLRAFVKERGLEGHVEFLGWRNDVPELLAGSDAMVLCSKGEGVPHVIREAMHAELPIVGTRIGGVPETIEHGETGFLVEVGDVKGLQECLEELVASPERRRSMGRKARRRAETVFSQEAWKNTYCQFLRERAAAAS